MKNREIRFGLFLLILSIVFIPRFVSAESLCLADDLDRYELEARKVKFSFQLADNVYSEPYYHITVSNLGKNLKVKYNKEDYTSPNGVEPITLNTIFKMDKEYKIEIYTIDEIEDCGDALVLTKRVKTPFYNSYSELDECIEYEEFPLCGANYKGEIKDYADFKDRLLDWINETKSNVEDYNDDRNIFQRFVDLYTDNIEVSVALTIVFGFLFIVFVIRSIIRRIKRAKVRV